MRKYTSIIATVSTTILLLLIVYNIASYYSLYFLHTSLDIIKNRTIDYFHRQLCALNTIFVTPILSCEEEGKSNAVSCQWLIDAKNSRQ